MDFQTYFTLVLSFVFAIGIAVAPYAMSIAAIDARMARWGVRAVWSASVILCVWYGGTNDMARPLRYSIAAVVSAFFTVMACAALDYITDRSTKLASEAHAASTESPPMSNQDRPIDNKGGIFIGGNNNGNATVNNFGALPPKLEIVGHPPVIKNDDGSFIQSTVVQVVSSSPPNSLLFIVRKSDQIVPDKSNPFGPLEVSAYPFGALSGSSGDSGDIYFYRVQTPAGQYVVKIRTKEESPMVNIEIAFNR